MKALTAVIILVVNSSSANNNLPVLVETGICGGKKTWQNKSQRIYAGN